MTRHPVAWRRRPIASALILLACLAAASCGGERRNATARAADADSARADSLAADSLAAAERGDSAGGRGGFFARLLGRRDEAPKKEDEAVPVEVSAVDRSDVPLYLSATASLEADKLVEIQAKAPGQIERLLVEEGDWVGAGQVLAVLDGKAQGAAFDEARVRTEALRRELERSRELYAQQGLSEMELSDVTARHDEAAAQLKAAEVNLDNTSVKAPFAGRVVERFAEPGQHVTVGTRLLSLVDPDPLLARIHVPEKEAVQLSIGQEVLIDLDALPGRTLHGEVLRIAPIVDRRTGTVKVTCQLRGEGPLLRPGAFVRVQVQTSLHRDVLVVPKRALVPEGGETYVYKVVADSVLKVGVATGYANGRSVEIAEGLAQGDRVVTVGQGSLKTGTKIRVIAPPADGSLADSTAAESWR